MSGKYTNPSIARERERIVEGIQAIDYVDRTLHAREGLSAKTILSMMALWVLAPTAVLWFTPLSVESKLFGSFMLFMAVIISIGAAAKAFGMRRIVGLKIRIEGADSWAHGKHLANCYVQTFSLPQPISGLEWRAVDRLHYTTIHDGITYTLEFFHDDRSPLFSVPEEVLPEDQRTQREPDVLFMHVRNAKADMYGIEVQLGMTFPATELPVSADS